jgi:hypothetical protein
VEKTDAEIRAPIFAPPIFAPRTSFREGLPADWEDYKEHVREEAIRLLGFSKWKRADVGKGHILQKVIKAIEIYDPARKLRNNRFHQAPRRGDGVAARGASAAAGDAGNWVPQHPITEQHGGERHERVPSGPERGRVRGGPECCDRIPLG